MVDTYDKKYFLDIARAKLGSIPRAGNKMAQAISESDLSERERLADDVMDDLEVLGLSGVDELVQTVAVYVNNNWDPKKIIDTYSSSLDTMAAQGGFAGTRFNGDSASLDSQESVLTRASYHASLDVMQADMVGLNQNLTTKVQELADRTAELATAQQQLQDAQQKVKIFEQKESSYQQGLDALATRLRSRGI
jgi:hypothetical protein